MAAPESQGWDGHWDDAVAGPGARTTRSTRRQAQGTARERGRQVARADRSLRLDHDGRPPAPVRSRQRSRPVPLVSARQRGSAAARQRVSGVPGAGSGGGTGALTPPSGGSSKFGICAPSPMCCSMYCADSRMELCG